MGHIINKCDCLVDIDVAENDPHFSNHTLTGDFHRGFDLFLRVAAKCHTGDRRYQDATYKMKTSGYLSIYDKYKFSEGTLYLPLVPDVFEAKLDCLIPGMN